MESLSSVSPSIVLPPSRQTLRCRHRPFRISPPSFFSSSKFKQNCVLLRFASFSVLPTRVEVCRKRCVEVRYSLRGDGMKGGGGGEEDARDEEVERALSLDGTIPGTSNEFLKQISSRAYGMRRNLHQTFDSSSYDVLESNPWRDPSKPVYVLTHLENQLCTMKTRRNRSEVERELGLLFSKGGKWRPGIGNQASQSRGTKFQMLVEDVREGVLVFEDEHEAAKYCDLLQGGGQNCEGIAEIEASSVFDLCQKMRALAVLFRRGRTPPLPESLKLNLRARQRSLEDQEDLV